MKKFVWLLFGICAAWGCTKHSGSAPSPVVSAISYWDVGHHRVMNLAFSYDDTGRLVAYTDEIIDSVPAIEIEEQTFTFRYAPGSRVPTRYEVNDHANVPAYSTSATAPEGDYQLQYDKQGRLVTD